MRVLITGACGFVGATLALSLRERLDGAELVGFDNLWRPGSETNRPRLRAAGIRVFHGDMRCASDFESLPTIDWVIDAAANASVLAGVDGATTARQLVEHNLLGTVNLLEYCRRHSSGLILLSSSRVYSISSLNAIPLTERANSFVLSKGLRESGVTAGGISEEFPTGAPASLYGSAKLASEQLAIEYAETFGMPVWIDRCGVMAGAGQFGQPAQGIFAWWINQWTRRKPLTYLGFGGKGLQVRDCLHPDDLGLLVARQLLSQPSRAERRVYNVSGGISNAMSLAQLSAWCSARLGPLEVAADGQQRLFDVPWLVLNSAAAIARWDWSPLWSIDRILEEIAEHALANPDWLSLSEG
jgi:CDP-paratose 2-epimerase